MDIDGYASIVAYTEFLQSQNIDAVAYSTAPFNASVPKELQKIKICREYAFKGDEKIKILKNLGLNVNVMIKSDLSQKPISATMIRDKIKKGENWKQYVPNAVFDYITKNHLENKIK